jgi:aspartate aminotransferase-like enzyme
MTSSTGAPPKTLTTTDLPKVPGTPVPDAFDPYTSTFLLAGPVQMHPRVLQAMATPALNHRGEYFHSVVREIADLLPLVFGRSGHQAVLTGSGTAGLEAVVSGLVRPDDRVLVISNGHFGDRMEKIVQRFATAVPLRGTWGEPVGPEALQAALETGPFRAVTLVYNETSVGFTNPVEEIGPLVRRHGALFLVDAISALPGLEPPTDRAGADAVVVGAQKGLAAPAGLSLVHLSERAYGELAPRTFYNDLKEHLKSLEKDDTPFTPAVPLFLALKEALLLLKEETPARRRARNHQQAEALRAAVAALGLKLYPNPAYASDTVTAIRYPPGVEDSAFRAGLRERHNVIVSGGQGLAKGATFRIGHMGMVQDRDLLAGVAAVERELVRAGVLPELGEGVRAYLRARG